MKEKKRWSLSLFLFMMEGVGEGGGWGDHEKGEELEEEGGVEELDV